MGHGYPAPDNEVDFENFCLRFYRKLWKNEGLKLYGKRGEKQDGVDIVDPFSIKPIGAIQCKHHERHKTLPPAMIKKEVEKAEKSSLDLDRYVIATTAQKTRNAQDTVVELNRRENKRFTVDIHFWEDICTEVSQFGRVFAELIIYGENILAGALAKENAHIPLGSVSAASIGCGDVTASNETLAVIEKLLDERRFDAARHEMEKQPDAETAKSLPVHDQYLLMRFRGRLALEAGEWEVASTMFLAAYDIAPESDQAKQNQVLALSLSGDLDQAYARAKEHIQSGVRTNVMAARLIDCVSSLTQLAEHSTLIDQYRDTEADVNTELCHKYIQFGAYDDANKAAEQALTIAPDSPHVHLAAAMAAHSVSVHIVSDQRIAQLHSAIHHYNRAESRSKELGYPEIVPEVLVHRGAAYMLLNQKAKAAKDFRAVIDVVDGPTSYANRSVEFFLQEGDYRSAWELLDAVDRSTIDGQYLALVVEYNNGDADERQAALGELLKLADEPSNREIDCRSFCVQWSINLDDLERAKACLSTAFVKRHPFQAQTLLAWIHLEAGDEKEARAAAGNALASSIENARKQDLRLLARILVRLKDDASALGLLEEVAHPGLFDDEMKALINCAQRLDRHDLLLRLCQEVREAGTTDNQLQRLEVDLLNRYAPEQALTLAKEFSKSSETPALFNAYHNYILVRLNRTNELRLDPSELPTARDLNPIDAPLVVDPYVEAHRYDDALRFFYAQRRQYFEEEQAQGAYLSFFLSYEKQFAILEPPETVSDDCAVLLSIDKDGHRWFIIEDDRPFASRDEFPSTNKLSQLLIGRSVGDAIELPGNLIQDNKATIQEIQSKYVRAFQDSLQNFRRWFPGTSVLQQIHVGSADNFDPSAIIASLEGRREHVEKCLRLYLDLPCSLYLFANRVGINELDAIRSLASHDRGAVKCCQTVPDQFDEVANAGFSTRAIVLDLAAIVTVTRLDAWRHLATDSVYFVSQLTSERIDAWLHEAQLKQIKDDGVAMLDDYGGLVVRETTVDERDKRLGCLQLMRDMIDQHCQRKSSSKVATIDPERRKLYDNALGMHNLEAIGVASECDGVLWSDDVVVGFIGRTDFGVDHVWTQLALMRFQIGGSLTAPEYDLATAKLASWNYTTIVWNAHTLIAAGEEAKWDTQAWPLKQCLALITKARPKDVVNARIVLGFIKLLRRSQCIELKQSAVFQATLDALGSPRAARWMLERIDSVFTVDVPSAHFVRLELQFWLSGKLR